MLRYDNEVVGELDMNPNEMVDKEWNTENTEFNIRDLNVIFFVIVVNL